MENFKEKGTKAKTNKHTKKKQKMSIGQIVSNLVRICLRCTKRRINHNGFAVATWFQNDIILSDNQIEFGWA